MANTTIGALSVKITADTKGVTRGIDNVKKKLSSSDKQLKKSSKEWQAWSGKAQIATAALAASVGIAAIKVIDYADAFTTITNKLKLATDGSEQLKVVTDALFESSNKTGSSVEATAELYAKMERATGNLNISQDRLLSITESINKSFSISGASTQEASGSIRQLGQALASGTLRGDEFNSIAEQAPLIMEAVSKATGKTAGELRTLAADGLITAKVLIDSLERYKDKIDGDYSSAQKTYAQKMVIARNNLIKFTGENDSATGAVDTFGDSLVGFSNNLETISNVVGVIMVAAVGKYSASLVTAISGQIALAAAQTTTVVTTTRLANGIGGYTLATTSATAATSKLALASRGLAGAMAFLGGPVGVILTAGLALAMFVDWEDDVETQTDDTTKKINAQIKAMGGLSEAALKASKIDIAAREVEIAEELVKQQKALNVAIEGKRNAAPSLLGEEMAEYQKQIVIAAQAIKDLKAEQEGLNKAKAKIKEVETGAGEDKQEKIDLDKAAQDKKDAVILKRQQKADAEYLIQIADRFKSAKELEEQRYNDELEIVQRSHEGKNELTLSQQQLEADMLNEHQENLAMIEAQNNPLENLELQTIGILEALGVRYESEELLLLEKLAREKEILAQSLAEGKITQAEFDAQNLSLTTQHEEAKRAIVLSNVKQGFQTLVGQSKKAQKAMKAIAIVNAVVKGKEAAVSAWNAGMSTGGPWAPAVAASYAAASIANTAGMINSIKAGGTSQGSSGASSATGTSGSTSGTSTTQAAPVADRNISINLSGQGLFSSDQVRELMAQINEEIGDGVNLNTGG